MEQKNLGFPFEPPLVFDPWFEHLPRLFHESVESTPLRDPELLALSPQALKALNWPSPQQIPQNELRDWLNGNRRIPGDQRLASRYAGHQFGVWAGQLGDGRAISLGEFRDSQHQIWEIQTKGSGRTPFSRHGDGKAVVRSSVREFLGSEAMAALGVPTTRALALIIGSDPVVRERIERSALVARLFRSNLRFGHFEYAFHFGHHKELQDLTEATRLRFFPEASNLEEMLEIVVHRTARLISLWQSLGFCHGVMNTDNMSVLGDTIDYGPFGFLDDTELDWICNHSDHEGRYAYHRQPAVALWNLEKWLVCFTPFVAQEKLQHILDLYAPRFEAEWLSCFRQKLGLFEKQTDDQELVRDLLLALHEDRLDFTLSFRELATPEKIQAKSGSSYEMWLQRYQKRLEAEDHSPEERQTLMNRTNPLYVLRNAIAQDVIDDVLGGSTRLLHLALRVFADPFQFHEEAPPQWKERPSAQRKGYSLSCSS